MECIAKIVKGCNYFRDISFSRFLLYEINIMKFSNTGLIFPPELFILCKKKKKMESERAAGRGF